MHTAISRRLRRCMLRRARHKARSAGFNRILPAGFKTSLNECFTMDRLGKGRLLIMLYFNVPGGNTLAVRHICQ